ncbi:hypothetical protein AB0E88_30275 [Streptomyces sp. NPDC028635]|uniref:hypothetical protein n=1 Tax=Streptomyces sp. NPDC028635 TaxID=3154800 RepID=UPI0033E15BF6
MSAREGPMEAVKQLRQLRTVYAWGAAAWTGCLLLTFAGERGTTRQTVLLLGLLAAFLTLLLWSTWCLWETGAMRGAKRRAETVSGKASQGGAGER